ncbi:hypothetical protein RI845_04435 [Thalassotalea nanhaiensis]|uniref:Uncharacterized protein n=1 Tax=Thalassotalea nanhaiensis TaxID=3065648 RepID=A0ABY9TL08_9GAMM|nr:hypothetical protein RI845_04435 [Colwelliaceae bacterium SQ345]
MFKWIFRNRKIADLIRTTTPKLVKKFGNAEYYTVEEIDSVVKCSDIENHEYIHFIYAMNCDINQFYSMFDKHKFEYNKLRLKVSKICFGSEMLFTSKFLTRFSSGENMKGNYRLARYTGGYSGGNGSDITGGGGGDGGF